MPYGTSIAVGSICGFVGIATYAVTGGSNVAPGRIPSSITATPPPNVSVERILANADHLPPSRVPAELIGANFRPIAVDNFVGQTVHLPIGQPVRLRLSPGIPEGVGMRIDLSGQLIAIDSQWVQLRRDGVDRFIARSQVVQMSLEPGTAAAAAAAVATVDEP